MLDHISFAWRNTLRNKRRTFITLLSIVAGYLSLSCFGGFILFSFEGLRESTIRTQLGHFQIYKTGFTDGHVAKPEAFLLDNPAAVEKVLAGIPAVSAVSRRLSFSGLATVGHASVTVRAFGTDPDADKLFSDFETIVEGRGLRPGDTDTGVVGVELRKALDAKIGDWVTVLTTSLDGVVNAVDFQLVGTAQTGSQDYDSVFVKMPLQLAQKARGTDKVERLVVMLDKTENLAATVPLVRQGLEAARIDYEIKLWSDLAGFYERVVALYTGMFEVLATIMAIVVMFAVANTMTMAVFERTQEIGALRAIGAKRSDILSMFVYEGIVIGLIGGVIGAALTLLISAFIQQIGGIPIAPPPGMSRGYQAALLITPGVLALAFAVTSFITLASSIFPAVSASRFKIVEALYHT